MQIASVDTRSDGSVDRRCAVARRVAWVATLLATTCVLPAASGATLQAFAGVVGGAGSGSIAGGCTTYGPPSELAFFGSAAAGLQVLGGNAACGYSGGYTNLTSTSTSPLLNSAALGPTVLGNPGYAESFDGTARSRAAYGALSAIARGHLDGTPPSFTPGTTVAASTAAAVFSDTLSASVPHAFTDLSSAGFVRYRFSIDGTLSAPGVPAAFLGGEAVTDFDIQQDHGPIYTLFSGETSTGAVGTANPDTTGWTITPGLVTGGATIESGQFNIDLLSSWDFTAGLIVNAYGNADDDFFSTATLVGVELFDHDDNPITDFSLTGASGTQYVGPAAVAVPEPTILSLIAAGLMVVASVRVVRSRRTSAAAAGAWR